MKETYTINVIARIRSDFHERAGIPRQSGLVPSIKSKIIFKPEYSNPDSFRELEKCQYIWAIWGFSMTADESWSTTVRPPHLGGKREIGVFASRSPFRPNPLALSCVKLDSIEITENGTVLNISGTDMADMSPVFDIKPYLPRTESHPMDSDGA